MLDERERACGVKFPASVREWFALPAADNFCMGHNYMRNIRDLGDPEHTQHGWLKVAWENQGVLHWFCRLDGSEDPTVWHDDNTYGSREFEEIPWVICSYNFSSFLFDFLVGEDYGQAWTEGLEVEGYSPSLPEDTLLRLQANFRSGPSGEWNGNRSHRFYNEKVLIYINEQAPPNKVRWYIEPVSEEALREVLSIIQPQFSWLNEWKSPDTRTWMYVNGERQRNYPLSQRILDEYWLRMGLESDE